ncbi:MAG: ATP-binding protein [bacterium]|nr:ATP-binding protein [bacterium]
MYLSLTQLSDSLERLADVPSFFGMSFLAFKEAELPIGQTAHVVFSRIAESSLKRYHKASSAYPGFYNPFQTSDPSKRWVVRRYPSTSLQRITTDTFGDALLHPKKSSLWGWRVDYVKRLAAHLRNRRIPAIDLAVWLFRNELWPPGTTPQALRDHLFERFRISDIEIEALFDSAIAAQPADWMQEQPIGEEDLLDVIGWPPEIVPSGLALHFLELRGIGPTKHIRYEPGERLNIITGDNSLGKTFLLDCAWWALTGCWVDRPALPWQHVKKKESGISFRLRPSPRAKTFEGLYDWKQHTWGRKPPYGDQPGLVIYARYDGSFAVWDPARIEGPGERQGGHPFEVVFSRQHLWEGLSIENSLGRERWICNGLLRDWLTWQTDLARYEERYRAFTATLDRLSPAPSQCEHLTPGEPTRLPFDTREIPTLRFPYGEVSILHCSAGVQRIVALGYLLVWAWSEHLENSRLQRRDPQKKLILLMDEVEAHLHPQWQRVIVPALIKVVSQLGPKASPQLHLATHSPLVLAGVEVIADESRDALHHLTIEDDSVRIDEIPWVRRGRADQWLISEAFGLGHPRSLDAEQTIEEAKALQLAEHPDAEAILDVHRRLVRLLAPVDDFWPRWVFFANQHGAAV